MVMDIQYPVAYVQPHEAVHIKDAQRGRPHFCFGCRREMVIRQGSVRQWHFAHKAGRVQCEKDKTLHEAAKAFICLGFRRALATGGEYRVGYLCERCETPISHNVASEGARIASEKMVVKGTRSDLVVFWPDGSLRVIIEIVVTHDLESDTKQRYQEANHPVVTVEPSWDTLPDLCQSAIGSRILNVKDDNRCCSACRDRLLQFSQRMQQRAAQEKRGPAKIIQSPLRKVAQKQEIKAPARAPKTLRQGRRWMSPELPSLEELMRQYPSLAARAKRLGLLGPVQQRRNY